MVVKDVGANLCSCCAAGGTTNGGFRRLKGVHSAVQTAHQDDNCHRTQHKKLAS